MTYTDYHTQNAEMNTNPDSPRANAGMNGPDAGRAMAVLNALAGGCMHNMECTHVQEVDASYGLYSYRFRFDVLATPLEACITADLTGENVNGYIYLADSFPSVSLRVIAGNSQWRFLPLEGEAYMTEAGRKAVELCAMQAQMQMLLENAKFLRIA